MEEYIAESESRGWPLDREAADALRGAHDLVVEAVFLHTDGHVARWGRCVSAALVGLVGNLERARQCDDGILWPRGLVPCVSLLWCVGMLPVCSCSYTLLGIVAGRLRPW